MSYFMSYFLYVLFKYVSVSATALAAFSNFELAQISFCFRCCIGSIFGFWARSCLCFRSCTCCILRFWARSYLTILGATPAAFSNFESGYISLCIRCCICSILGFWAGSYLSLFQVLHLLQSPSTASLDVATAKNRELLVRRVRWARELFLRRSTVNKISRINK